jgi:hypothetical protein
MIGHLVTMAESVAVWELKTHTHYSASFANRRSGPPVREVLADQMCLGYRLTKRKSA